MTFGASIAAEVLTGLQEAGSETGAGKPVVAVIMQAGEPSGTGRNQTVGTSTDHPCTVVYSSWSGSQVDGTLVRATDQRILVAAADFDTIPKVGDKFWDGVSMNGADRVTKEIVAPLKTTSPGGVPIMYILNVRG